MKRFTRTLAGFLTVLGIVSLWPFSGGEDVTNARENILRGERTDFWGGFSQLFYSSFTLDEPKWHILLGLIHAVIVLLGTLISLKTLELSIGKGKVQLLLISIHFIATIYVLNLSRDATLLAFAWLGTSLILNAIHKSSFKNINITLGIFFVVIGFAFRPWLTIGFMPFILTLLYLSKKPTAPAQKYLSLFIPAVLLAVGPLILDLGSKRIMDLKDSYPEQQVMILDLASVSCLSPEKAVQSFALLSLQPISTTPNLDRERLCGQFYPQSWASLTFYSNPNDPALRMIEVGESSTYEQIRNSWVDLITDHPIQYIQVKIFQVSQLFFAGDSFQLLPSGFNDIPLIPYELIKALRIFSFFPILLLFSWITFSSRFKIDYRVRCAIISTYVTTIGIVTIAFIGDNQRYISWLAMLLLFAYINAPRNLGKVRNS